MTVADRVRTTRWAAPVEGADAVGQAEVKEERLVVRIGVWAGGGRVEHARYRASTCATLLALTDAACEWAEGRALDELAAVTPAAILELVPGVGESRKDRAAVVVAALHAAASKAARQQKEGSP